MVQMKAESKAFNMPYRRPRRRRRPGRRNRCRLRRRLRRLPYPTAPPAIAAPAAAEAVTASAAVGAVGGPFCATCTGPLVLPDGAELDAACVGAPRAGRQRRRPPVPLPAAEDPPAARLAAGR